MGTASADLGLIDAELKIAALLLDGARTRYREDPCQETRAKVERAQDDVDRLLDRRLAVSGG
ncbi:hypothetical protein [Geodermatophilus sp. URMC 64]